MSKNDTPTIVARIYLKGGSVIVLPNVENVTWSEGRSGKTLEINQREGVGYELILMAALQVSEVVALTYERFNDLSAVREENPPP